jgi:hypothetical protein
MVTLHGARPVITAIGGARGAGYDVSWVRALLLRAHRSRSLAITRMSRFLRLGLLALRLVDGVRVVRVVRVVRGAAVLTPVARLLALRNVRLLFEFLWGTVQAD